MRFTSILATASFALLASAAGTATSSSAPAASVDPAQAKILACLDACTAGDVSCTSKCIAVPNPNEAQVNATNTCVAACPQGNGSPAETEKYSNCVQDCIGANYYKPSSGTPQPTGAAGGSGNGNSGNGNGGSSSNGGGESATGTGGAKASGSSTGSAAKSTSSGAAAAMGVGSGMAGMVGLVAAVWAL